MNFEEIKIEELKLNPMTMIGEEWWLITGGNEEIGFNTMTASWGHLGSIWERPTGKAHVGLPSVCVYIRPQRYTKEFMDKEEYFTLSVFDASYKRALAYLGTHSGKDENKIKVTGLSTEIKDSVMMFQEANLVFICKKVYQAPIVEEGFIDKGLIDNNYRNKDFHEMYIGEIIKVYRKKD